ncbi:PEP-CTERM sorting domain-containing protein [Nostoc flagelliforme FACHB-838]|uniref:PEP-CTERM sorting domain-containing protein n=1 Tax=Nostoc flagelliforme FACHB-838 TaxID=2692904 RepID=A0ABR8E3V8_9NOSO|nr:PEP-CTERM sorting domain-containing protein [Nostoc flagelliforme FACHB-838]
MIITSVLSPSLIKEDNTGLDNLFFWERGRNSDLGVQAVDTSGNLIGNFLKLDRKNQANAGYSIDTLEISNAQQVGSWGVSLKELGVTSLAGIRLTANGSYNGPDFKVAARQSVPEPATILGLGVVAGLGLLRRRRCN